MTELLLGLLDDLSESDLLIAFDFFKFFKCLFFDLLVQLFGVFLYRELFVVCVDAVAEILKGCFFDELCSDACFENSHRAVFKLLVFLIGVNKALGAGGILQEQIGEILANKINRLKVVFGEQLLSKKLVGN